MSKADLHSSILSKETLEGWRITGKVRNVRLNKFIGNVLVKSFVDLVRYLFALEGSSGRYFLSATLNQDPLEGYFGQQRARGGRSENPSVKQALDNSLSLRQQRSMALDPVRGNSRQKRRVVPTEVIDDTPLPKRRRAQKSKTPDDDLDEPND